MSDESRTRWPVGACYVCELTDSGLTNMLKDREVVLQRTGAYGREGGTCTAWLQGIQSHFLPSNFDTAILKRRTIWARQLAQGVGNEY